MCVRGHSEVNKDVKLKKRGRKMLSLIFSWAWQDSKYYYSTR